MIKITPRGAVQKTITRNFTNVRLPVWKLVYSTKPEDYFSSAQKTACIVAESVAVAEKMLADSIGPDISWNLDSKSEAPELEICAISNEIKSQIFKMLLDEKSLNQIAEEYDPLNIERFLKE